MNRPLRATGSPDVQLARRIHLEVGWVRGSYSPSSAISSPTGSVDTWSLSLAVGLFSLPYVQRSQFSRTSTASS